MDWKALYNKAFPADKPFTSYSWPDLPTPGAWDASSYGSVGKSGPAGPSSYPQLAKPGPGGASSYPALPAPGPGEGSVFPQLQPPGPSGESKWPELEGPKMGEGSSYPMTRTWLDHIGDFGFIVSIEGLNVGAFTKVEGLTVQIEPIEYQHSDDITPRKRMGRIKVDNVRLIKGYVATPDLFKWCEDAMKGDISRKSMSIVLLGDDRSKEMARYNLFEVWPTKWSGFKLDGQGRGALVEEIELVVEQIERA